MARTDASPAVSVERFFQSSLSGLVASGYLAVAGSGYLDLPTIALTAAALVLRGLLIYGFVRLEISERATTFVTIAYTGVLRSRLFSDLARFSGGDGPPGVLPRGDEDPDGPDPRDHLYTAVIAFLELVAAAILSINFNFFLFLALYLLFAIAALTSGEIRRSMHKAPATARSGLRRFHPTAGGAFVPGLGGDPGAYRRAVFSAAEHGRCGLFQADSAPAAPARILQPDYARARSARSRTRHAR